MTCRNHIDRERNHWARLGLDLVTLRVFRTAVEERSLVRAAEIENLAVSAISRRIAFMESRMGAPLLVRHARGVEPTVAGRALLCSLAPMFAALESAAQGVALNAETGAHRARDDRAALSDEVVRLHANLSALLDFVPGALAKFEREHPTIDVSVEEHTSAEIIHAVSCRRAEVGVIWDLAQPCDLELIPCRMERLVVLFSASHALAGADTAIEFRQIAAEPFICLSTTMPIIERCRNEARSMRRVLRERCTVNSLDCVKRLVSSGAGIALVPEAGVSSIGEGNSGLRWRPLQDAWASRMLSLCIRRREQLFRSAGLLVDRLAELGSKDAVIMDVARATRAEGQRTSRAVRAPASSNHGRARLIA
jgi:DNA-binding transcriptional LysR family regulator